MTRQHWKAECVELVRLVDPAAGKPLYFLAAGEVRGRFCLVPQVRGFTAWPLCHELRAAIGVRWSGPGFCTVLCRKHLRNRRALLAVALHEYAHYIAQRGGALLAMLEDSVMAPLLRWAPARRPGETKVTGYTAETFDADHGPRFYRIAGHVVHRSWRVWGGDFVDIVGAFRLSQLSDPLAYRAALGDEPARLAGEPLAAIAASDPPAGFAALAREDAARVARHFARNDKEG